jgi:DNA (cytosine-5)-methyltransferase 1
MLILDGCCGIGGITRGLTGDGRNEVWGVDSNPKVRDDYLRSGGAKFIHGDILEVLSDVSFMRQFDGTSISCPCQGYSRMANCRPGLAARYPKLIKPVRERLEALPSESQLPWVLENVSSPVVRAEMQDPITVLCMYGHFGREMYRHRLLRAGGGLVLGAPPARPAANQVKPNRECGQEHPVATARAGHWKPGMFVSVAGHERKEPVRRVMEIDWASKREDVAEAVPPYVGAWIAGQFEAHMTGLAA